VRNRDTAALPSHDHRHSSETDLDRLGAVFDRSRP